MGSNNDEKYLEKCWWSFWAEMRNACTEWGEEMSWYSYHMTHHTGQNFGRFKSSNFIDHSYIFH